MNTRSIKVITVEHLRFNWGMACFWMQVVLLIHYYIMLAVAWDVFLNVAYIVLATTAASASSWVKYGLRSNIAGRQTHVSKQQRTIVWSVTAVFFGGLFAVPFIYTSVNMGPEGLKGFIFILEVLAGGGLALVIDFLYPGHETEHLPEPVEAANAQNSG